MNFQSQKPRKFFYAHHVLILIMIITSKNETCLSPASIVSLVPSITELLCHLNLADQISGVTKFCISPAHLRSQKVIVGGTKKLDMEKIISLQPDLIIANKEENTKADIETLAEALPVLVTDVNNLFDALEMIDSIGFLTNRIKESKQLINDITTAFLKLQHSLAGQPKIKVLYLIWQDPFMTVGGDTFISDMLSHAGFINGFQTDVRYPATSVTEIEIKNVDLILLSSEPFPFSQNHLLEFQKTMPSHKFLLVDGEMFSWYGSKMLESPAYFEQVYQSAAALIVSN